VLTPTLPRLGCGRKAYRKRQIRALIDRIKADGRCVRCGTVECLTFHHVRFPKRFSIGDGTRQSAGAVRAELASTCLLCKSCHSRVHDGTDDGAGLVPIDARLIREAWLRVLA
jgi:5-methylcytosine-specific restriction endonuclease McrA